MGKLTAEQKSNIARRMIAGEDQGRLAKEFSITTGGIRGIARRRGYTGKRTPRKIAIDETVFSEITPASAYWAGFLMADGCVSDKGLLQIRLSDRDLGHLEKFRDFIKSKHKIHHLVQGAPGTNKKFGAIHFAVFAKRLVADLSKFGVVPRKSLIASAGACVSNNRDFWRGVIDGDGSIGIWGKNKIPEVRLSGSLALTTQFIEYAQTLYRRPKNSRGRQYHTIPHKYHNNSYAVGATGYLGIVVAKTLYVGTPPAIRLERKFKSATKVVHCVYGNELSQ